MPLCMYVCVWGVEGREGRVACPGRGSIGLAWLGDLFHPYMQIRSRYGSIRRGFGAKYYICIF